MRAVHVGARAQQVRDARLASAERVVAVGNEYRAEYLIVAGDLFEDNAVDRVLVQRVADILSKFHGTVLIIPGNHDPYTPGSVWHHPAWTVPTNIRILIEPAPVTFDDLVVYPCPLREKFSSRDPTLWIRHVDRSRIALGIAHGTVSGVNVEETYFPIATDVVQRSGLDYLALGHWHSTAFFEGHDGATRMVYSGTHETTKFGERDSGNVVIVDLTGPGNQPSLQTVRTGMLDWVEHDQTIHDMVDLQTVRQWIESHPRPESTLLSLRLNGVLHPGGQAELARIEELAQARFFFARTDFSALLPSPQDDRWIDQIPAGVLRQLAHQLRCWMEPSATDRPQYASPEMATRAFLELYRLCQEAVQQGQNL